MLPVSSISADIYFSNSLCDCVRAHWIWSHRVDRDRRQYDLGRDHFVIFSIAWHPNIASPIFLFLLCVSPFGPKVGNTYHGMLLLLPIQMRSLTWAVQAYPRYSNCPSNKYDDLTTNQCGRIGSFVHAVILYFKSSGGSLHTQAIPWSWWGITFVNTQASTLSELA